MDARQVGGQLVELCRQGRNIEAINTLYSDDIVSVKNGKVVREEFFYNM